MRVFYIIQIVFYYVKKYFKNYSLNFMGSDDYFLIEMDTKFEAKKERQFSLSTRKILIKT